MCARKGHAVWSLSPSVGRRPSDALSLRGQSDAEGAGKTHLTAGESDYAVRLREKQRLRAQYGISEKQLRAAYEKATRTAGQTGNAMLTDLETLSKEARGSSGMSWIC